MNKPNKDDNLKYIQEQIENLRQENKELKTDINLKIDSLHSASLTSTQTYNNQIAIIALIILTSISIIIAIIAMTRFNENKFSAQNISQIISSTLVYNFLIILFCVLIIRIYLDLKTFLIWKYKSENKKIQLWLKDIVDQNKEK